MSGFDSPLDNIGIASPCSANWDEMFGDERKRFCGQCSLNVYDLSGMTRDEAEGLLLTSEGRVCVRYYKRADGTVLTKDCPVGWARLKRRLSTTATAIFSLVVSVFTGLFFVSLFSKENNEEPRFPMPVSRPTPQATMGRVSISSPESKSPKTAPEKKGGPGDSLRHKVLRQSGV